MEQKSLKIRLAQFGRILSLLCNRALMYRQDHPVVRQSIEDLQKEADGLFQEISPIVFILNRDLFYVDEEPIDPRVNVSRIANWFKTNNVQSVSFEPGLNAKELTVFAGIFSMPRTSDVQELKDQLSKRGAVHIKINHVVYKKVSEDDQVISREALQEVTPVFDEKDQQNRKGFMETLLESVLTEEFAKTLNINSLMANPGQVSKNMIAADLAGAAQIQQQEGTDGDGPGKGPGGGGVSGQAADSSGTGSVSGQVDTPSGVGRGPGDGSDSGLEGGLGGSGLAGSGAGPGQANAPSGIGIGPGEGPGSGGPGGGGGHGHVLLQQLEMMQNEVQKHLEGDGDVSLGDLAGAVFDLKKQLLEGLQAQKALGVAYENETEILARADQLTDQVLIELIKQEYQAGKITTARLAYLIKRLVPDADDLKRLLPQIKAALLAEGMSMDDYLSLLKELSNELQSDDLVRILQENLESMGIDGADLIDGIKADPEMAAKLMYMASEIRKGGGDEAELTNFLVEYIETSAGRMIQKTAPENSQDEGQVKKMVSGIESDLLSQLSRLNVNTDALQRLEQRLNDRMESVMDKMRLDWLENRPASQSDPGPAAPVLTVLQTLENNVFDDEELGDILENIRGLVDAGEIDENNYSQIHAEITRQKQRLKTVGGEGQMVVGVLNSDELFSLLEKEIAMNKRYDQSFCALGFMIVSAKTKEQSADDQVSSDRITNAALELLADSIREVDSLGRIGKNKIVAVLPTLEAANGKKALERLLRLFHAQPLNVDGVDVQLRVAGVVTEYDSQQAPDAVAFAKQVVNHLTDMATRVKNVQVLF